MALALVLPSVLLFAGFVFYPLAKTFYLGMFRSDPFGGHRQFVGLAQYRDVLGSHRFHNSLVVTLLFALLTVPSGMVLGLVLAVMANQRLKGVGAIRTIFSSTVATSSAVASLLFLTLLNPNIGLVNFGLKSLGRQPIDWLGDPNRALIAVALTTIWQHVGLSFIVFTAGLLAIPAELVESATLDGAGPLARFVHVTIPLLSPTLLFAFVALTINAFQSFGQIDILTGGGPLERTNVLVYSIYATAFRDFDQGRAAAAAVVLFAILLVFTVVNFRFLERRVSYDR
jgi:ABC-type sugar transport system permease subunit